MAPSTGSGQALNSKYLQDGERLLEQGDYPQASEKFWGATAQAVKAVASARRWRHASHRDLIQTISRLYQESNDADLLRLFSVSESLHDNFYEDYMDGETVKVYAEDVQMLVEKLWALAG